jgi:hypothetical protein
MIFQHSSVLAQHLLSRREYGNVNMDKSLLEEFDKQVDTAIPFNNSTPQPLNCFALLLNHSTTQQRNSYRHSRSENDV